jgi:hypothetical protein
VAIARSAMATTTRYAQCTAATPGVGKKESRGAAVS